MRVHPMTVTGSYEVVTDGGTVLGWIDVEARPDPATGTSSPAWVAKPVVGQVRARASLSEAAAHIAGSCN